MDTKYVSKIPFRGGRLVFVLLALLSLTAGALVVRAEPAANTWSEWMSVDGDRHMEYRYNPTGRKWTDAARLQFRSGRPSVEYDLVVESTWDGSRGKTQKDYLKIWPERDGTAWSVASEPLVKSVEIRRD